MSQKQRILRHLKRYAGIDPLTAWERCGVYRLGARIFDLRQDGYKILTSEKKVVNRFGEECKVAYYRLVKE